MIPKCVLQDIYFHADLDEITAKEYLSICQEGNLLFCRNTQSQTGTLLILAYKAIFNEQEQVRFLPLRVYEKYNFLFIEHNSSLGSHFSLYSVINGLGLVTK